MVKQLVDHLGCQGTRGGGDFPTLWHVDLRLSNAISDIGKATPIKLVRLLYCCFKALRCRFTYRCHALYYVPAPDSTSPMIRDLVVMILIRPFFRRTIWHFHAMGLASAASGRAGAGLLPRLLARLAAKALRQPSTAVILGEFAREEAMAFAPHTIAVIPNGMPDPCPDWSPEQARQRRKRVQATGSDFEHTAYTYLHVGFLGLCSEEKGLFRAVQMVDAFNTSMAKEGRPLRGILHVGGEFAEPEVRNRFFDLAREMAKEEFKDTSIGTKSFPPLHPDTPSPTGFVRYYGFLDSEAKARFLSSLDVFTLPSFYPYEAQPLVLLEAKAHGLPCVITRWRGLPEIVKSHGVCIESGDGTMEPEVGLALQRLLQMDLDPADIRADFLANWTLEKHLAKMKDLLFGSETADSPPP